MAKDEKKTITINGVEYDMSLFTEEQVTMYNHVQDLNRKLSSAMFNVDQLKVGQDAFVKMLLASLEAGKEVVETFASGKSDAA